jgi:isocitrate dehydrogenase
MTQKSKIVYTLTDEAPLLATYSFLPIVQAFTATAGIEMETKDISLAARILSISGVFKKTKVEDALSELGNLANSPHANIIKLPNISASVPQLKEALLNYKIMVILYPFPEDPKTRKKRKLKQNIQKF